MREPTDPAYIVPALPGGKHAGVMHEPDRDKTERMFVARDAIGERPAGTVYVLGLRSLDLIGEYQSNENTRRAWCRLSGVPYGRLKAALQKRNKAREKAELEGNRKWLERRAAEAGMRLVPAKKQKVAK